MPHLWEILDPPPCVIRHQLQLPSRIFFWIFKFTYLAMQSSSVNVAGYSLPATWVHPAGTPAGSSVYFRQSLLHPVAATQKRLIVSICRTRSESEEFIGAGDKTPKWGDPPWLRNPGQTSPEVPNRRSVAPQEDSCSPQINKPWTCKCYRTPQKWENQKRLSKSGVKTEIQRFNFSFTDFS